MNLARFLTHGVGSWLRFESACNRSGLFSEKYLAAPIGQILNARLGARVIAEYKHPVLAPLMEGRGRRPAVDFIVLGQRPQIRVAVESKWIGKGASNVQAIIWDLIRLELIAHAEGAECFFILGGRKRHLAALFENPVFARSRVWQGGPLLETTHNQMHKVPLTPVVRHRIATLKAIFRDYQNFAFPEFIVARRSAPFPEECTSLMHQVYTWKISSARKRTTFYPEKSPHYATSGSG